MVRFKKASSRSVSVPPTGGVGDAVADGANRGDIGSNSMSSAGSRLTVPPI